MNHANISLCSLNFIEVIHNMSCQSQKLLELLLPLVAKCIYSKLEMVKCDYSKIRGSRNLINPKKYIDRNLLEFSYYYQRNLPTKCGSSSGTSQHQDYEDAERVKLLLSCRPKRVKAIALVLDFINKPLPSPQSPANSKKLPLKSTFPFSSFHRAKSLFQHSST